MNQIIIKSIPGMSGFIIIHGDPSLSDSYLGSINPTDQGWILNFSPCGDEDFENRSVHPNMRSIIRDIDRMMSSWIHDSEIPEIRIIR